MTGLVIVVAALVLAALVAAFVLRYTSRAPWWRSLEGRTLVGMMATFLLILVNLAAFRLFAWPGYEATLAVLLSLGIVFMVSQNVVLTRARRRRRGV